MGELGDGTGSSYPSALDSDNTLEVANSTTARADVPNDLASAVVAIETELGIDPAGTLTDVKTYLQTEHNTDGTHDNTVVALLGGTQTVTGNKTFSGTNVHSGTNTMSGTYTYTGIPINPATACFIKDDFTGNMATGEGASYGDLGWFIMDGAGGGASVAEGSAVANHPGIWVITTANGNGDDNGIYLGPSSSVLPADTFDITVICKCDDTANVTYQIGLVDGDHTVNSPSDGIYFEHIGASDTNWYGVTRASSTETRTDTSTAHSTSWVKLRLRRVDASTIGFTVDGGTEVTATANIPTSAMDMYIAIETNTTASKSLQVDYFHMLVSGITR